MMPGACHLALGNLIPYLPLIFSEIYYFHPPKPGLLCPR